MSESLLTDFTWHGMVLYSAWLPQIPTVAAYVTLPRLTGHPTLGDIDTPTQWSIHAVEWHLEWEGGRGELPPSITVHLRRLHPHEWGNRHEPTGYTYADPLPE